MQGFAATNATRWRPLIAAALAAVLLAVVATGLRLVLVPRQFSSTSTFALGGTFSSGTAAGLAEQLGFAASPPGDRGVDYYIELFKSDGFLERVTESPIRLSNGRVVDVASAVGVTAGSERRRAERAARRLRRTLTVTANRRSGIVSVTAHHRDSCVAAQLANLIVAVADSTNISSRAIRGRSEREFLETRAAIADSALRAAQDRLAMYISSNRAFESDAFQRAEVARLQFAVEVAQQLKLELARSLEAARLEEVRNTPVIGILFPARARASADPRGLTVFFTVALVLALAVAVIAAIAFNPQFRTEVLKLIRMAMTG